MGMHDEEEAGKEQELGGNRRANRSRSRDGGRYSSVTPADMVIRLEALADRVDVLEKMANTSAQWVPWLWTLFSWLEKTFVNAPPWWARFGWSTHVPDLFESIWLEPDWD